MFTASWSHDQDSRHAYMVKTLQKVSSPEPVDRLPQKLVYSILDSSPSKSQAAQCSYFSYFSYFSKLAIYSYILTKSPIFSYIFVKMLKINLGKAVFLGIYSI